MNIAVFGLGYVGIVNIACLSQLGHTMWGCDIKSQKVDLVKKGKSPIFEPGVDEMLIEATKKELLHATTDAKEVINQTDLALICVGTPSLQDGTVNLDYTLNTTREIAQCLNGSNKKYTIVYRSTIPPGTVENHFIPLLKEILGEKMSDVTVAFIPEFLREGSAVKDFFHCSRIVIGSQENEPTAVKSVFGFSKDVPLEFTDIRTAEFVKYVDNAFHALKIAFANEVYSIGSAYGVNISRANELFLMDKHLNISPVYLRPGLPFGGSCLPKDMRAINHLATQKKLKLPLLESVIPSNKYLQEKLFHTIVSGGHRNVGLFGLTFKSGTDDVRESPMLILARQLSESGVGLHIFDPDINLAHLRVEHPWIVKHVVQSPLEALHNKEAVVVCKKGFGELISDLDPQAVIYNFFNQEKFQISNRQYTLY